MTSNSAGRPLKKIGVVGAGLIGSSWSIVFARSGFDVKIFDPEQAIRDRLPAALRQTVAPLQRVGLVENTEAILERITIVSTLPDAVGDADYVQESVFERVDIKQRVSLEIDAEIRPVTIVGSSSSGIPASEFTADCRNRERFLVVHPVNPPHLLPVVEIVPAPWTDSSSVAAAEALLTAVEQVPVIVRREIEGFILNRLQGALLNEAFALYRDGYASVADIDKTVAFGLGPRWSFMGPFETIDLNAPGGIADYAERLAPLYHRIALSREPQAWPQETIAAATQERREQLDASELSVRSNWRDNYLTELAAFRAKMARG